MNLQDKTLHNYKQIFPNDTLKLISHKTGIQMTRVFRLFNGSEMRLSEFIAFEQLITNHKNSPDYVEFIKTSQACVRELSSKKLKSLFSQMQFHLKSQSLQSNKNPVNHFAIA